jgi:CspA family cold shock protein
MGEFTGKVVWFNDRKGYGFIEQSDGKDDLFCHYTNINIQGFKTLAAGQIVSYNVGANQRGPQAVEVEIVGDAKQESVA